MSITRDSKSMSQSSGSWSIIPLTSQKFPSEFENVFIARSQSSRHNNIPAEKVIATGADRWQRIEADDAQT